MPEEGESERRKIFTDDFLENNRNCADQLLTEVTTEPDNTRSVRDDEGRVDISCRKELEEKISHREGAERQRF